MQHGGQAYLEEVVVVPQCGHSEEERHQKDQTHDAPVSFEDVERNTEYITRVLTGNVTDDRLRRLVTARIGRAQSKRPPSRSQHSDRGGVVYGKERVDEDGGERRCKADEDVNDLEEVSDILHWRVVEALPHEPEDQQDNEEERCEASDVEGDADVLEVVHHFPAEHLLDEDDSHDVRQDCHPRSC